VPSDQPKSGSSLLKQLIGIVFAGLFLWLAFRGTDPAKLWSYIKDVQPFYLVLVCLSGLVSHFLRALRWVLLLSPLSEKKISLWNSFCAVMYGYAVNVVVPRGGEVARLVSISKTEKLPWVGVLSTMFIDRLLDIALLVLLLGFTLTVFPTTAFADMKWLVPGGISLSIATVLGLLVLPQMAGIINWIIAQPAVSSKLPAPIVEKVENLSTQFDTGCRSLKNPVTYPAIAGLSLAIWVFYWLNFYLMIYAFGLQDKVSPSQCLVVFTIGSVGVLVPTPGNVGSFHFLVSQGLSMVSGVNHELALAFASLLHVMCFVLVTCVPAAVCFVVQTYKARPDEPAAAPAYPPAASRRD
jgi:uncharacterized protein (TIRG00374 family)